MKKIYLYVIFLITLIPNIVFADIGMPTIQEYKAKVINTEGARYYDSSSDLNAKGKLDYNSEITVMYENDGYAGFMIDDERYEISIADIRAVKESVKFTDKDVKKISEKEVLVLENINIYNGPAEGYEVVGYIPKGAKIVLLYEPDIFEGANNIWYGVKYNGIDGWINGYGTIGYRGDIDIKLKNDVEVVASIDNEKVTGKLKKNTIISQDKFYTTNGESVFYVDSSIYLKYNNVEGFISSSDVYALYYNAEGTVKEKTYLYDKEDIYDDNVKKIVKLPKKAKVKVIYQSNEIKDTAYYVEYNGKKGWVEEYKINVSLSDINKPNQVKETTTTMTTSTITTTSSLVNEEKDKPNISTDTIIILCLGGALLITLTALVTLILIRKK